jgi:hypothetical protein
MYAANVGSSRGLPATTRRRLLADCLGARTTGARAASFAKAEEIQTSQVAYRLIKNSTLQHWSAAA